jgi:HAE1 family hydrophobic/amphiphilic exporter-1
LSIATFAVSRRVTVAMIAAAITLLGIFALPRLPVALLPAFASPVVTVTVNYGTVAPATMESTVTRPIENAVARVSGIDYLQSSSYQGQSVVRAIFKYGTDINVASVDIQQQVARASSQLPNDPLLQQPQILKADPNSLPVARLYITDPTRTNRALGDLFTNTIADEFSAVSGVGSVGVGAGQTRAIMVEPDVHALAANGLTLNDVVTKIGKENVDLPAGIAAVDRNEYTIRTTALFTDAREIANMVVAMKNGSPIYLRNVASVRDDIQEQRTFSRLDGAPAVSLTIIPQPDSNIVAVAEGTYAKMAEIKRRYPSMHFGVVFDQRGFIVEAIDALEHTAIYGAILAVLIILLFLHSLRSTLIVAVSLPVSVLGTLFAAYLLHQSLNTMTLGGLALAVGLIVDDAVVVIENIFRHLAMGESPRDAARNATQQIFGAVLASTVTVATVFVPLLLIPGLQGLIFGPLALVVMVGVAISLLVAVTTVPMLSSIMLSSKHGGHGAIDSMVKRGSYARFSAAFDAGYERFEGAYRRLLAGALDRPALVLGIGVVAFVGAVAALKLGYVQTETFPASESRYARFDLRTPKGTSLARTDALSQLVEAAFKRDPRVVDVGSTVGSGFGGGFSRVVANQASLSITLRSDTSGQAAGDFVTEWQRRLGGGTRRGGSAAATSANAVSAEERDRRARLSAALVGSQVFGRTIDIVQQSISGGSDDLTLQIYGDDVDRLYRTATDLLPKIAEIPGVVRPDTNVTAPLPEIDIAIDRRRAAQFGFATGDVANIINTATAGTIASYYQTGGVQYPILVQLSPEQRRSFAAIAALQITPPAGAALTASGPSSQSLQSVPLTNVASVSYGLGPSQINRQNKQRRIDIDATVVGQPLGSVLAAAAVVMNNAVLPSGYRWDFGPEIKQNGDTFSSLGLVVVLAIVLIYMLLASQFESFLDPLVIMMSVPLALAGVVGSLMLTHRAFGLTAFIGALMLVGIAVKNAILVVEFTKQLRRDGMSPRAALLAAGPMRLRPILMTTLATLGGMLPLALGIEAGSSTQAPLGTVVIGGLLTSTLLTLVVVPTLYLLAATHLEPRFTAKPPRLGKRPTTQILAREPAGFHE